MLVSLQSHGIPSSSFSRKLAKMAPANDSNHGYDDDQASTNYKEAFSLFDKRGTGRVALESLGDLLRACGQNPTLAEIKELEKSVGGDCKATSATALVAMDIKW